jgi:hypothetical protein
MLSGLGGHAETDNANIFSGIRFETRSRTLALLVRCRFDHGLGLYCLECRQMRNCWTSFF